MQIRFIKNPVGKFNLSYEVGEVVDLPDQQAKDIIEDGYAVAEAIEFKPEKQTAESKVKKEKR